ncbi:hypothetical protein [Ramlibacter sp.]|uniref:hypothetical protein n=1 Tax=Ramlibacter sp. TaxID=1917967 RepID=UPI0026326218|nr:hypothetical protein [Ramlibacter sp.]MDB5561323.1 hypothetical protein [Hyphomicrobiales bacterium]MDB5958495.1 hypothetical protein [Ramlibacter sp.]
MSDKSSEPQQPFTLPVPVEAPTPRPTLTRTSPKAAFLSQLLAERQNLPPQRARRRATVDVAVDAYATGARASTLRMPSGYRKTIVT